MRLSRCELRDQSITAKRSLVSYRFYRALQRLMSPMRYICEIFGPRDLRVVQHNPPEADSCTAANSGFIR